MRGVALIAAGCAVLAFAWLGPLPGLVPASFALMTGKDHWQVLLRARAIENQCFVIAPGQHGKKPGGRVRFGQSVVVDPWGTVLAQARDVAEDVVVAELDLEHQDRIRRGLPCLQHRRVR